MNQGPFSTREVRKIPNFPIQTHNILNANDGEKLAYYHYEVQNPEAIVIFYHGGGIYNNKAYQWIGYRLQQDHNIESYLFDVRGHGNSGGIRGDAPTIEHVWRDVDTAIEFVRTKHPDKKLYLAGHSAGGALLLNHSFQKQKNTNFDGYVFIAPYLGYNSGTLKEIKEPNKRFTKKFRLWVYILNSFINLNCLKHIRAIYFNYSQAARQADPLILESYTYAMSMALTTQNPQEIFANLDKPFALYNGDQDEMFYPEKVIAYKELASKVKNQSYAELLPGEKHISILVNSAELIAHGIKKLLQK
jgi:alpha-beta hydrolase superfamily lysophospholipase